MDKWGWALLALGIGVVAWIFFKSKSASAAESSDEVGASGGAPASGGSIAGGMTTQATGSEGGMARGVAGADANSGSPSSCGPGQFWSDVDKRCKNAGETPDPPPGGLGFRPSGSDPNSTPLPVDLGPGKPTPVEVVGGRRTATTSGEGGFASSAFRTMGVEPGKKPTSGSGFARNAINTAKDIVRAKPMSAPAASGKDVAPSFSGKTFLTETGASGTKTERQLSTEYGNISAGNKWGGR